MFESNLFHSWFLVLLGGMLFAGLFGFVAMLSDLVLGGELQVNQKALSMGALAFVGYVGVAALLKSDRQRE